MKFRLKLEAASGSNRAIGEIVLHILSDSLSLNWGKVARWFRHCFGALMAKRCLVSRSKTVQVADLPVNYPARTLFAL